jgi:dynein heavy chain
MAYIIGDSLITAAFQSYAGPFPSEYRDNLMKNELIPKIKHLKINYSS